MAASLKRVCCQAARSRILTLRRQRPDSPQWQIARSLSGSPAARRASPASEENPYLTPFPQSSGKENANQDPAYEEDDISSLGHAELDQHRELREMVRIAAWEMPRLSQLHKPWHRDEKQILRWRYTTYMGEVHPAASKVVVEFRPADLPDMTEPQRLKLLKLAGPRYNPETGVLKMSCESFETQAQNKRYLGDTVAALIAEAKDPQSDSFEDVPLDTRHVKPRRRPQFPEHWLITEERRAELDAKRAQQLLEEGRRVEEDRVASGVAAIEAARQVNLRQVEEPVMAEARLEVGKGKMGKREKGQTRANQR